MFELISVFALGALVYGSFVSARRFVRERLRFVDAAQRRSAPWVAGGLTTLVLLPVVALLPVVGAGTALLLGVSVGMGVARGAADVRRRDGGAGWTPLPRL